MRWIRDHSLGIALLILVVSMIVADIPDLRDTALGGLLVVTVIMLAVE